VDAVFLHLAGADLGNPEFAEERQEVEAQADLVALDQRWMRWPSVMTPYSLMNGSATCWTVFSVLRSPARDLPRNSKYRSSAICLACVALFARAAAVPEARFRVLIVLALC
jgi:hypothetical protein